VFVRVEGGCRGVAGRRILGSGQARSEKHDKQGAAFGGAQRLPANRLTGPEVAVPKMQVA